MIQTEIRKNGPFNGDGTTTAFVFAFAVYATADVRAVLTAGDGTESDLVMDTDYTVVLNGDQDANPGGTLTKITPLALGTLLMITSDTPLLQPLALTNQGNLSSESIDEALDRLTILQQQTAEQLSRAIKAPISSVVPIGDLTAEIEANEGAAQGYANQAATYASQAAPFVAPAQTSASQAAGYEATSATSGAATTRDAAETSAANAAASADLAATYVPTAQAQAAAATNSANAALASKNLASSRASATLTSANNAAASADAFDDRYLGVKAVEPTTDNDGNALAVGALYWHATLAQFFAWDGSAWRITYVKPNLTFYGLFEKADPYAPAFTKTGTLTATIKAGTRIEVATTVVTFASDTAITMPTLTAGTDFAIWLKDDGTIQADANFAAPPGTGNWRSIGGFHFAIGSNPLPGATGGGNQTPQINEYSFWDLNFRPDCPDPRGMTCIAGGFWSDIYMLCAGHYTYGTSKYGVALARNGAPPKVPASLGGDGTATMPEANWWCMSEVLRSWGKRLPTYDEFALLSRGTYELGSTGGSDVGTAGVSTNWWLFTSSWGTIQSSGCLEIWGADLGGPAGTAAWGSVTDGRGGVYQGNAVMTYGGYWADGTGSGSRRGYGDVDPSTQFNSIGTRGVCGHLVTGY